MKCKHNDCGWCYATPLENTSATNGQCNNPDECKELEAQKSEKIADDFDISQSDADEVVCSKMEPAKPINATTAIYAFAGFIGSMKTPITFSENHWATPAADIAAEIIKANGLDEDYQPEKINQPDWDFSEAYNPVTSSLTNSQARELNTLEFPDSPLDATCRENEFKDEPNQFDSTVRRMANENAAAKLNELGYELTGASWNRPVTDEEWVDGLPPIGVECEVYFRGAWESCIEVFHYHNGRAFFDTPTRSKPFSRLLIEVKFRPIKTAAQIAEEERKAEADKIMKLMYEASITSSAYGTIAKYLYDDGLRIAQGEGK